MIIFSSKKKYERGISIFNNMNISIDLNLKKFNFEDRKNLFEVAKRQTIEKKEKYLEFLKMREKEKKELEKKRIYNGNVLYGRINHKKTKFERMENLKRENLEVFQRKKILNKYFGHNNLYLNDEYLFKTKVIIKKKKTTRNMNLPFIDNNTQFENEDLKINISKKNKSYLKENLKEKKNMDSFLDTTIIDYKRDKSYNKNKKLNERYISDYNSSRSINSIKFNTSDNYTINHFVNSVSFSRPKTKLKIIIGLNKNLH
jgi:hypothetical protein